MFCCEVIQLFVYHKNPSGNNLSIFACTEEIDAVLLFCSIFVIDVPCIKGQFAYVSFSPKSCILFFFSKAAHSAGQHTPENMLHSPTKWLTLSPSFFNTWSHRRVTQGLPKAPDGATFFCVIYCSIF